MIHATRAAIRKWLDHLLHIHDSPQRTAAAYALGVFFGFAPLPPFLGLHTALALACAFTFNLNRVAVLLGVYSNLPWILAPYYTLATMVGAKLLGMPLGPRDWQVFGAQLEGLFAYSVWHGEFWRHLAGLLRPFLWPFVLGGLIGASVLSVVAYRAALAFVIARRRHPHPLREIQREIQREIHLAEMHIHHRHPPVKPGDRSAEKQDEPHEQAQSPRDRAAPGRMDEGRSPAADAVVQPGTSNPGPRTRDEAEPGTGDQGPAPGTKDPSTRA